uniref:Uncharacterized protein n=1 Tax=Parascaris equorum TaxID=6256 RepID=A0A914R2F0_PAREQ
MGTAGDLPTPFSNNGNGEGMGLAQGSVSHLAGARSVNLSHPVKMPPLKQRFALDPSNYNVDDIGAVAVNETVTVNQPPAKSSTVQEIERLQRNREERRAHQVEVKKQKEQLKNIDPGNPNWQFLTMI